MKKLYQLFIMLMLATLTVACSDDDDAAPDPVITITTSEFIIAAEQDSQAKALFNINVDWIASISYEGNAKDWLTVTPTSGKAGDVEMIIKATENPSDTERKAFLTINYEGGSHQLTITQIINGAIDITAHFDAKFAIQLQRRDYIPNAKKILLQDVIGITELDVSGNPSSISAKLTSLAGIEYFKSLTSLICVFNQLTTIDLSKNTALTELVCYTNQLTTLDLSKNTALTYLDCVRNQLTTLDLSKNTALTYLDCYYSGITMLDLGKNTALTHLYCYYNQLTTLDISKNTALTELNCYYNQLTTLDISKNTALTELNCYDNQLTTLDISKNTALTELNCSYNPGVGSTFIVKSWFDNNNIPLDFITGTWYYNEGYIAIDYQKVRL